MKKVMSIIMAAIITLGLSVSAFAESSITQDSEEKSGNTNVDYSLGVSYTVTIPASVTFTDTQKEVDRGLLASNVILNEGSTLSISVSSLNGFVMRNGEGYIDYSLKVNYNAIPEENNFDILIVYAGESSGTAILSFATDLNKENAHYAGKYTDTLTFTVSVE